jgi:hypothetical protein
VEAEVEERFRALEARVSWLEGALERMMEAAAGQGVLPAAPPPEARKAPPPPQTGLAIMVAGEQKGFLPYAYLPEGEDLTELAEWVREREEFGPEATLEWRTGEEDGDGTTGQSA